jgi:glutamine cyclotransferase
MKVAEQLSFFLGVFFIVLAVVAVSGVISTPRGEIPVYTYDVVHSYPHDRFAFTEGLAWDRGVLIESTGLKGDSTLRRVNLTTGQVIRVRHLADRYFGEGVTVLVTKTIQLTYDSHTGFIDAADSLEPMGSFNYSTMGWGIAWDGRYLVMSDGSSTLYFLDPETYQEVRRIDVTAMGEPVGNLNELEYVKGEVYANVWPTNRIAMISPETGEVRGWIDLSGLLYDQTQEQAGRSGIENYPEHPSGLFDKEDCLNGIAYDPCGDRLFVTGKFWPRLYEIRVVPG